MRRSLSWVVLGVVILVPLLFLACASSPLPSPSPQSKAVSAPSPITTAAPAPSPKPTTTVAKPAAPAPTAFSFAGKTITIIVPSGAGGGADIMSRLYATHLSRLLPGKPNIIVRNMPGGAGTIGANYFYTSTKPDGLTTLAGTGGIQVAQLLGSSAAKYDLMKTNIVIGMSSGGVIYARSDVVDKRENLLKAKGGIFGGGAGSSSSYLFIGAQQTLNFPTDKVILAYSNNAEARRAFLSRETNMSAESASLFNDGVITAFVNKGEVTVLFQNGTLDDKGNIVKTDDLSAEIPTIAELYQKLYDKPPSGIAWDAYKVLIAGSRTYDQLLYLPPGTPENILRAYWIVTETMIKDADFRKAADQLVGQGSRWGAGESYDKAFKANFGIRPEVRDWLRSTLPKYGMVVD